MRFTVVLLICAFFLGNAGCLVYEVSKAEMSEFWSRKDYPPNGYAWFDAPGEEPRGGTKGKVIIVRYKGENRLPVNPWRDPELFPEQPDPYGSKGKKFIIDSYRDITNMSKPGK